MNDNEPKKHYFFSGIGGSGMMPLALILRSKGVQVSGSDRAFDNGHSLQKFEQLQKEGITLHPQDGSGLKDKDILVISTAVEDDVPDVIAAQDAEIPIIKRADLLAELFNSYEKRIAVGGTSGKTTVTGMIGFILQEAGYAPTMMNGGVLKNYGTSMLAGGDEIFVTEADESDGSIALYNPEVAVLNNISVDHKSMNELRDLFRVFVNMASMPVINMDDDEAAKLIIPGAVTFGLNGGQITATDIFHMEEGVSAVVSNSTERAAISLELIGEHNLSNALAAIGAVSAYGLPLQQSCDILGRFSGIKRRMEYVGEEGGVIVMDDFAHNPDKVAASLKALKQTPGRLLIIFQMHGYGPLKLMLNALADSFADNMGDEDVFLTTHPLYLGGTADKSIGTQYLVEAIGDRAAWYENRELCAAAALEMAEPGDRIIVMGARDDTLSDFAADILQNLAD